MIQSKVKIFLLFLASVIAFQTSQAQDLSWVEPTLEALQDPIFPADTFSIEEFGAQVGREQLNSQAFTEAIASCNKSGGGVVLVPPGLWRTGPIHLKSNVNLHVSEGAIIEFSDDFEDYLPVVLIQRGGYFCYNYSPPIYGNELEHVAITGKGTIDGNGSVWWPWKKNQPGMVELFQMGKAGVPIEERVFGVPEKGVRPPFVQFIKSKDLLIDGPTFKNGPSWMIHPVQCKNLIIRNISIKSHGPNNDGIDPDMCENVLIENCVIDAGDDNIAIKSGRDEEAWKIGIPSKNIIIRNCRSLSGHGGFVIGSEMSAGVQNVLVENCDFSTTDRGIRIKTKVGRGGVVENIYVRNIRMEHIKKEAILFNMMYDSEPIERAMDYKSTARAVPYIRNIRIENLTCTSAGYALTCIGLGQGTLENIIVENTTITADEGIVIEGADQVTISGIDLDVDQPVRVKVVKSTDVNISIKNDEWDEKFVKQEQSKNVSIKRYQ